MDLGLTDQRILVGGASRGLGAAVARALAAEGAGVALAARPSEELTAVAAETGGTAVAADLSTPDGPAGAVRDAVAALGGLDGLLVNSGGPSPGTFAEIGEEAWEKAIAGTLQSTLRLIRAALPHLRDGRDPAIAIILSSSVREPIPALITSNVLRPGIAGLLKALVPEIAPIRINGLAPGRFGTERIRQLDTKRAADAGTTIEEIERQVIGRIPLGRYGDPDELGRVAAFLLSPAASYLTGVIVPVDGGMVRSLP
jgi:3-oxoacyl-[acyl-carrier protein] reductase